jgi:hypothetical protein
MHTPHERGLEEESVEENPSQGRQPHDGNFGLFIFRPLWGGPKPGLPVYDFYGWGA